MTDPQHQSESGTRYEDPNNWEDARIRDVFAAGEVEEWDMAVNDLRELLELLETVDWADAEDVAEVEEAIDHGLLEVQKNLHDAFDSMRGVSDV